MIRALSGILAFVAGSMAAPLRAEPAAYSLDGLALGSNLRDLIVSRGNPRIVGKDRYDWTDSVGRRLIVLTRADGSIVLIDVRAGANDERSIELPALPPQDALGFGESSHANYVPPPEATESDDCGPTLVGSPCLAFTCQGT